MSPWRRLRIALAALGAIIVAGTIGYRLFGLGWVDALYQTVTTISTVGFRELRDFESDERIFTIGLILVGVGMALYTFSVLVETLVEGRIQDVFERRRMIRRIGKMEDHVIVCGWGRVGKALTRYVTGAGGQVVIVDQEESRLEGCEHSYLVGDATDDTVLREAGIERARALVAAIDTDAENLYVTLSGRSLNPALFIVARTRLESSHDKFVRAGADRVVNPQAIGGARMAAFVLQPHVAEFVDVVMHDGSLEFRLEEVQIPPDSPVAGRSLRDAHIRDETGALILAMRDGEGNFRTNPEPETVIDPGEILIAVGTVGQLKALGDLVRPGSPAADAHS